MSADSAPPLPKEVASRVAGHSFSPVDNGFTVDPDTEDDGVSDLQSTDWRVRVRSPTASSQPALIRTQGGLEFPSTWRYGSVDV